MTAQRIEELLGLQKTSSETIHNALRNYKKDSATRKTIDYLNKRLNELKFEWRFFNENNNELNAYPEASNQPYFQNNVFLATKAAYEELLTLLNKKRIEIENNEQATENNLQLKEVKLLVQYYKNILALFVELENLNDDETVGYLHAQVERLKAQWIKFEKMYDEVQILANGECDKIDYNGLDNKYACFCGNLYDKINKLKNAEAAGKTFKNSVSELSQMPKIKIPEFDGKLSNWKVFIGLFNEIIHNNANINDGIKMQYLKTHVKGEAAKLINHVDPTAENYAAAYDLLKKRYENKRELLASLIDTILNLPVLTYESGQQLKRMHDTVWESILAIQNLQVSINNWDPLLTHILMKKLDKETVKHYECQLIDIREPQKLNEFLNYIENRFMALESAEKKQRNFSADKKQNFFSDDKKKFNNSMNANNAKKSECFYCQKEHAINACDSFLKLDTKERSNFARNTKLCTNCLKIGHSANDCKNKWRCKNCNKNHHTLLHFETSKQKSTNESKNVNSNCATVNKNNEPTPSTSTADQNINALLSETSGDVILATALVNVYNLHGQQVLLRALIDQGSQKTFISEKAAELLLLPRSRICATITGIGAATKKANHSVQIQLSPRQSTTFSLTTEAIVLDKLTDSSNQNSKNINVENWKHLKNIYLADPFINASNCIDILLGAGDHAKIIKQGLIKGAVDEPIAQNTEFGWIVSGQTNERNSQQHKIEVVSMITMTELDEKLKIFFTSNEINEERKQTDEEEMCEKHFIQNHYRQADGRYVVKIPFINNAEEPDIGNSRNMAIATLLNLEKKFEKMPNLYEQYKEFIDEYINLGHMQLAKNTKKLVNYLPHHAVFKESTTTKLRVVFDASRKTSNNKSLNDNLAIGKALQCDMTSLIIRWRKHCIAFTADIEKMYRQILIHDEQKNLQRIVWRNSPNEKIREYNLATVTYGTANAPYLAIRTLHQLAKDVENTFPIASKIIMNDFYVDDVITGADTVEEAINIQRELKTALKQAGFNLRKYASNSNELLTEIPEIDREIKNTQLINIDNTIKALGIIWKPSTDEFKFKIKLNFETEAKTKRMLLSEIASLFDPLGWIAPVIIKAKILMQEMWILGKSWDDELPKYIRIEWLKIKNELPSLEELNIPRWINTNKNSTIELHGFCDASEAAYGAVIYIKTINSNNDVNVMLLTAKTKVAPIKKMTIPRLELCAALLLSRLAKQVIETIQLNFSEIFMWSDSKIVLGWIKGNPKRYNTFVANQAIKINSITNNKNWNHVVSAENPADCSSRGLYPKEIHKHKLWWNGPHWLVENKKNYPKKDDEEFKTNNEEKKNTISTLTTFTTSFDLPSVSSFYKLRNIIALCIRFVHNMKNHTNKKIGSITVNELSSADEFIFKFIQGKYYSSEIEQLKNNIKLHSSSNIRNLNPFIDSNGILRVGGRIQNANISFDAKHQILLPKNDHVTELIIKMIHVKSIHGGPKLTEAILRQKFWIVNGYNTIKKLIHKCIKCHKYNAKAMQQFMGNLPATRVNLNHPFVNSGIDYAGPINVRTTKGRGHKSEKGYLALFICLATKAIHIEVVSDLTADGFIAAFYRFVSRRGSISNIYSDNGTNFVKANKILQVNSANEKDEFDSIVYDTLAKNETQWHFIPPSSPHFGGLWEAGVKSAKTHLKKAIGDHTLTFEELTTLVYQIEASLNSRPLCALSSDVNDITSLTPGHFLIGRSLLAPPETNYLDVKTNRLTRWQLVQKMHQQFWNKWRVEYLNRLQQRPKWLDQKKEVNLNDLVLIKDENLPPGKWPLARVIEKHPGTDGLTRVVTLKIKDNTLKRPIHKICPLPSNELKEEEVKSVAEANTAFINKSKKKPSNIWPIITTLFALFMTGNCQHLFNNNSAITTTKFDYNPGIYFEQISTAFISNDNWNIIAYYDLKNFVADLEWIRISIARIKTLCQNKHMDEQSCTDTIQQLENHYEELIEKNKIILGSNKNRRKRAALDIIGNIASDLFGVLDSRFAKQYAQDVGKIKENENHLLMLLRNHTSIAEIQLNMIKKSENSIANQYKIINNMASNIEKLEEKEAKNHRLMTTSFHILTSMMKYETTQAAILDVLLDAHKSHINPNLITPKQLEEQIKIAKMQVDKTLVVPGDDTHDIKELYRIMTIQAYTINNQIIFKLTLPLLFNNQFQVFKLISVPTLQENKYIWVEPTTKYLAATLNRNYYFPLNDFEYEKCISYAKNMIICSSNHRLFNSQSKQYTCEWKLLNHNKQLDDNCKFKFTSVDDIWIPLTGNNNWIYIIHREYPIDIICGNNIQHTEITGEGILHLQEKCSIRHAAMEITAQNSYQVPFAGSIIPRINITTEIIKFYNTSNYQLNKFITSNTTVIEDMLRLQREQEFLPEKLNLHEVHHYTMYYILLSIVIGYIIFKLRQSKRKLPAPAPRMPRTISMPNFSS